MSASSPHSPGAWLTGIVAPLTAKFGTELTVSRSENTVCWGYDGQSAVIELVGDDALRATFIDSVRTDAVSAAPAAAAYRTGAMYALTPASCGRMVEDLVDFFSGVREPRFVFIDAYPR